MNNGIKPTRLWHRTAGKHFWKLINNKFNTRPRFDQRSSKDRLQLLAILVTAVSSIAYSYGMFSRPQATTTSKRPPGCDGTARVRCPNMSQCPPDVAPTGPCRK